MMIDDNITTTDYMREARRGKHYVWIYQVVAGGYWLIALLYGVDTDTNTNADANTDTDTNTDEKWTQRQGKD